MSRKRTRPPSPWNCPICNTDEQRSVHHIEPKRLHQNNSLDNKVGICRPCHDQVERWYEIVILFTCVEPTQTLHHAQLQLKRLSSLRKTLRLGEIPDPTQLSGFNRVFSHPITIDELNSVSTGIRRELRMAKERLDRACCVLHWPRVYQYVTTAIIKGWRLPKRSELL